MNKGFTILELLVSMIVIVIGVLGAYSVTQKMFILTSSSSHRLTAAYLAQGEIETVRNARDTNWIKGDDWKDGISSSPGWGSTGMLNFEKRTTVTFSDPELEVIVEVRWDMRNDSGEITIQENLYDWK